MKSPTLCYTSWLPLIYEEPGKKDPQTRDEMGETALQRELWRVIWAVNESMKLDPKHMHMPAVARQYYLELGAWGTFCKCSLLLSDCG